LGFAEAEEHGLGFFGVARHGGRWCVGGGGGVPLVLLWWCWWTRLAFVVLTGREARKVPKPKPRSTISLGSSVAPAWLAIIASSTRLQPISFSFYFKSPTDSPTSNGKLQQASHVVTISLSAPTMCNAAISKKFHPQPDRQCYYAIATRFPR
jgi:hypothetical protein